MFVSGTVPVVPVYNLKGGARNVKAEPVTEKVNKEHAERAIRRHHYQKPPVIGVDVARPGVRVY